jgi:hypothetical protein
MRHRVLGDRILGARVLPASGTALAFRRRPWVCRAGYGDRWPTLPLFLSGSGQGSKRHHASRVREPRIARSSTRWSASTRCQQHTGAQNLYSGFVLGGRPCANAVHASHPTLLHQFLVQLGLPALEERLVGVFLGLLPPGPSAQCSASLPESSSACCSPCLGNEGGHVI